MAKLRSLWACFGVSLTLIHLGVPVAQAATFDGGADKALALKLTQSKEKHLRAGEKTNLSAPRSFLAQSSQSPLIKQDVLFSRMFDELKHLDADPLGEQLRMELETLSSGLSSPHAYTLPDND